MGSIQHRPERSKPWKARYRGPDRKERSVSFTRKVDAERHLRAELSKMDRGVWIDPTAGDITLSEWTEPWLQSLDLKPSTRASYESLLRSRVLPSFGDVPISKIEPTDVRTWVAGLVVEGLSASRIRQARHVLRASLEQAVADGRIGRNPTAHVKVPADRPREQRFLDADQVATLADTAESLQDGAGVLVRFLSYSGLRWGEAIALPRTNVDTLRARVHVRTAATEVSGEMVIGTPKSHRSRTVVLPRFLLDRIAAHLASHDSDRVFLSPAGGMLRSANFRRRVWLPALEAAQIEPGLRIHDLRHTAASLMISSGASIKAVQMALGHASATITLDRYSHLYQDDLEALADRLDERYRDADAAPVRPRALSAEVVSLS